jgi:hypothetical protein
MYVVICHVQGIAAARIIACFTTRLPVPVDSSSSCMLKTAQRNWLELEILRFGETRSAITVGTFGVQQTNYYTK